MMSFPGLQNIRIDSVQALSNSYTSFDVLRLDLVHPVISGNKYFKLKKYLHHAKVLGKNKVLSFGGAWSNHIVATAAAAKENHLKSIGIIRGERPAILSPTLKDAEAFGMELHFISRHDYQQNRPSIASGFPDCYVIEEGGYGKYGALGAKEILDEIERRKQYTHIIIGVGTGTTLAGIAMGMERNQKAVGISVMKNNYSLQDAVCSLSGKDRNDFEIIHEYHFGGYAKHDPALVLFMNQWYEATGIPSDFVYTGKLFYAVNDLIGSNYFPLDSKILVIHSGGLQGNRSLKKGTLIF